MKLAIVASLIAGAAAFAPAQTGKASAAPPHTSGRSSSLASTSPALTPVTSTRAALASLARRPLTLSASAVFPVPIVDNIAKTTTMSYMPDKILPPVYNRDANSTHRISRLDMQRAINDLKRFVEDRLEKDLNLVKHTCPLAFTMGTGINDDLDGSVSKRAVQFTIPNKDIPRGIKIDEEMLKEKGPYEMQCEVVQSLAKWKRVMLDRLGCKVGEGIYCDSTSIRKGYKGDVTHSAIADQYDFESRINEEDRNLEFLKDHVRTIWKIITDAEDYILEKYPDIILKGHPTESWKLPKEITFVTSQELHDQYPDLDVHGRENAIVKEHSAVFIIGMGWPMSDGSAPEEVRSPGYDDWNLNGDIMCRHPLTEYRHEVSSMGIRVDKESLLAQLEHRGMMDEAELDFFKAVIEERVPFSYGGGIGISRLAMLLLRTAHIGEVQVGLWHDAHYKQAAAAGIDMIPDRLISPTTE